MEIKTVDLTKKYKDFIAVDKLNLSIKSGELFALLGTNGAGKTTTIKMLSCLTKPTSGNAYIFGKSILSESHDVKKMIAVSPQESAVAPNLSVEENLSLMCGIYGFSKEVAQEKIKKCANTLGLCDFLSKKAGKLSGGQKRRVSIAMALISEPKVLFLDEPTLGLDVISRRELWDIIFKLKGKVTIILTTHYMEEAEKLSDRVGVMQNGKLLAVGEPNELVAKTGATRFEDAFVSIVKGCEI